MKIKNMPNANERSSISIILILGFTTLIILIVSSGFVSKNQISLIRSSVTNLEQDHLNQINTILKLRELISQIYIESRETTNSRRTNPAVAPYVSLPPNIKSELEKQLQTIESSELGKSEEWTNFNRSLKQFIHTATDPFYVSINGLSHQTLAFNTLDEVVKKIRTDRTKITLQINALQIQAERYIIITTAISLIMGLLVAALTVIEIRKRLHQLQQSFVAINEAREFNRDIINGVVNALFTLDAKGNITSANQAFYDLFYLSPDVSGHYQEILKKENDLCRIIENAYEESPTISYGGRINIMPRKKVFTIDPYITTFKPNNKIQGLIIVLVDVTEMEKAREERQRRQALAAIGQIAAQVAHEIKNPLGGIKLNLSYLQRTNSNNEEAQEVISEISTGIDRLNKTVSELSNFVRPKQLMLAPTDVNTLIDQELAAITDKIKQKNINIERNFDSNLPSLLGDHHELRKAFINFLINAIDASSDSGTVKVSTLQEDSKVIVTFIDSGVGMDRETLSRLFEPFFTTKTTGTGLGMSIAKKVIEMHEGNLIVKSKPREGTQITIELPTKPK